MRVVNVKDYLPHGKPKARRKAAAEAGVLCVGKGTPLGCRWDVRRDKLGNEVPGSREQMLTRYREWLWRCVESGDGAVLAALRALPDDVILGCSCKPKPCHADVIVEVAEAGRPMLQRAAC
jgi:hypothetical protein